MKMLINIIAVFSFLILILPVNLFAADKQQFCNNYADTAVKQYYQAKQLFKTQGPAWSDNRAGHYHWCMAVPEAMAKNEQDKRQAKISEYQGAAQQGQAPKQPPVMGVVVEEAVVLDSLDIGDMIGTTQRICENYAKVSVQQNKQNLSLNCGFNPPSWSSDYNAHKNWCLHGTNYLQADKQLASRKKQLATCSSSDLIWIPGMVLGVRNLANNWDDTFVPATKYFAARGIKFIEKTLVDYVMSDTDISSIVTYLTVDKGRYDTAINYELPSGIVIGLGYGTKYGNGAHQMDALVFGVSASNKGPEYLPGGTFKKYCGGDLGAASGEGWCWYESTGIGFKNWSDVNKLPRGTVIGLKHNRNQPNKKLIWQNVVLDPADPSIPPPPGFARKVGGDRGAPSGVGYFWYEKITGE